MSTQKKKEKGTGHFSGRLQGTTAPLQYSPALLTFKTTTALPYDHPQYRSHSRSSFQAECIFLSQARNPSVLNCRQRPKSRLRDSSLFQPTSSSRQESLFLRSIQRHPPLIGLLCWEPSRIPIAKFRAQANDQLCFALHQTSIAE